MIIVFSTSARKKNEITFEKNRKNSINDDRTEQKQ